MDGGRAGGHQEAPLPPLSAQRDSALMVGSGRRGAYGAHPARDMLGPDMTGKRFPNAREDPSGSTPITSIRTGDADGGGTAATSWQRPSLARPVAQLTGRIILVPDGVATAAGSSPRRGYALPRSQASPGVPVERLLEGPNEQLGC
jgi:hypothetical protein